MAGDASLHAAIAGRQILLDKLRMELPKQPPPRIKAPVSATGMPNQPVATLHFAG